MPLGDAPAQTSCAAHFDLDTADLVAYEVCIVEGESDSVLGNGEGDEFLSCASALADESDQDGTVEGESESEGEDATAKEERERGRGRPRPPQC